METSKILRFEESRARLVQVGERVRSEAIEREIQLLERLEAVIDQLQERIRAEKSRLRKLEEEAPSPRRLVLPIAGYDELTAKQVLAELEGLTDAQREQVLAYERENKNRKTVVRAIEGRAAA